MSFVITANHLSITYEVPTYRYTSFKEMILAGRKRQDKNQVIHAVKDLSFTVQRGESLALIGHNGCGKSTLLKAIAGVIRVPNSQLAVAGRIAPMIELGAGFDGELNGRENIILSCMIMGSTKEEATELIESVVAFSELADFIDMPVKNYSSGMYARLGFACATAVQPDILLVDEVLSVGDTNFSEKCLSRIQEMMLAGTTIIIVSHDMGTLRRFCKRGIVMERGEMRFDGHIDDAIEKQFLIMEDRRTEVLSAEAIAENRRLAKLRASTVREGVDKAALVPEVTMSFQISQDGAEVQEVDVAREFFIDVTLVMDHRQRFKNEISVGLGINVPGGQRIGGCNNLQLGEVLERTQFIAERVQVVRFTFAQGIPDLCARSYEIVIGLHDEAISRDVATRPLGTFQVTNSRLGINPDGDVIPIHKYASHVALVEKARAHE